MPEIPGALDVSCGGCGAHYQLDPSGSVAGAACDACGGTRFFRSQPSPTQSDGTLRDMVDSDTQRDQGGNPLGEGTIMGTDGENPMGKRDNYMHSRVAAVPDILYESSDIPEGMSLHDYHQSPHEQTCPICQTPFHEPLGFNHHLLTQHPTDQPPNVNQTVAKRVEPMRTFNMEPYAPLWDESYIPSKTAGPLAELAAPLVGGLARALPFALPSLMRGALGQGGGQQAGGMAPEGPTPAPSMGMLASTDIPFVLMADYDTPHSVKSIGEQHDDPENQDQKEFNDGDQSPKNLKNPNLEDSGQDGEDGARDATEGYGIGENSPSVERAQMILPLLLHYFHSDESGQSDPLIRALHDSLEKESPGYLENEHPEGQKYVELVIQQHGQHAPHQAGVNAFVGELPAMPTPGNGMQGPGGRSCPNCGGMLAGDGSCPQCGSKQHPQGGMQQPTGMGGGIAGGAASTGGPSYPPNRVGTSGAGPQTPEQKAAVVQLLQHQGREGEVPLVELEPWRFAQELAEIQGQPNVAPLVDPSQAQPTPAPMPAMMNPPGAMPVSDPTQAGGGMGMPMQPMAHVKNAEAMPQTTEDWHHWSPDDQLEQGRGECPHCRAPSFSKLLGHCEQCGYQIPQDSPDVGLVPEGVNMYPGDGAYTQRHEDLPFLGDQHWGKKADANNAVPRCPHCGTATTSYADGLDGEGEHKGRCHNCQKTFALHEGRVILTDLMNPALEGAGEQKAPEIKNHDDSTLTWKDTQGQQLIEGATYSLHTPGYQVPEEVQVVQVKPHEVALRPAGDIAGIPSSQEPAFKISTSEMETRGYQFEPSNDTNNTDETQPTPLGGMPGLEQIPQQPETTDELSSSYPNKGTMSSVLASQGVEEPYDDLCHKCGCDWISHTASSETTTMHECARCGSAWETRDEYTGHHSKVDLSWLSEDPQGDDFHSEMERARNMRDYSQQSRSLTTVAAKDDRLQAVRDVLSRNKSDRERTAGRHFTPSEQRALVNERGTARNLDDLDLTNTHYTTRYDPTGKANGLNVPDEHLLLGI